MRSRWIRPLALGLAAIGVVPALACDSISHVKAKLFEMRVLPAMAGITFTPGVAPACATNQRTVSDPNAADLNENPQTQVIYFVPSDQCDEGLDQGTLQRSLSSINAFYVAQGLGPLKMDRTGNPTTGALDIPFVKTSRPASSYSSISDIAADLGDYHRSYKRFIIFATLNLGGICGQAEYPGQFAGFFLNSDPACGVRDFSTDGTVNGAGAAEVVVGHEIIHNEGVVSLLAPHGCQISLLHYAHICFSGATVELGQFDPEWRDIMFPYAMPGVKLREKMLDPGHDDYFQTGVLNQILTDLEDSPFWG